MAKITKSGSEKAASKTSKARAGSGSYKVAGSTSDGVKILTPKVKATHFTSREVRSIIAEVRDRTAADSALLQDQEGDDRSKR